jgi:hypothetical protein
MTLAIGQTGLRYLPPIGDMMVMIGTRMRVHCASAPMRSLVLREELSPSSVSNDIGADGDESRSVQRRGQGRRLWFRERPFAKGSNGGPMRQRRDPMTRAGASPSRRRVRSEAPSTDATNEVRRAVSAPLPPPSRRADSSPLPFLVLRPTPSPRTPSSAPSVPPRGGWLSGGGSPMHHRLLLGAARGKARW